LHAHPPPSSEAAIPFPPPPPPPPSGPPQNPDGTSHFTPFLHCASIVHCTQLPWSGPLVAQIFPSGAQSASLFEGVHGRQMRGFPLSQIPFAIGQSLFLVHSSTVTSVVLPGPLSLDEG